MKQNDFELYCEIKEIGQTVALHGGEDEFISFLQYCAERLDRGDSVRAIWNDYQERV